MVNPRGGGGGNSIVFHLSFLTRDRGDHFKVEELKNLANARNIKFSVLPFIWHLRAILFTASTNIT